jgi:type I restriction enzyme S subunit
MWPSITVNEACCRIIDYRGKTPKKSRSGIRLVTAKVVKAGRINEEPSEFIAEDYFDEWMRRGLPELHDTVITSEAPLGEVGLIRTGGRIALGQRVILLRPDPAKMDKRYLHQVLQTGLVQGRLHARATGTTVLGIKQSELRRVELPCPPIETQRRIGSILGTYDDLIEVNRRRIRVLEEMARGLFEEWFVRFRFPGHEAVEIIETPDGRLPRGWAFQRLGSVAAINANTMQPAAAPEEIGYIDIASVSPGEVDNVSRMPLSEAPGRARRLVKDGSILWSNVRPSRRSHAVLFDPAPEIIASTGFTVLDAQETSCAYLYHWVTTDDFVGYLVGNATGAAYPAVTASTFQRAHVLLPPDDLVDRYSLVAEAMMRQAHTLRQTNSVLAASRDLLLPRLISGQLTVEAAGRALEEAA